MSVKKHAVILFSDVAGYMALKEKDEKQASDLLHRNKKIHYQIILKHNGRLLKEIEDGILASFDLTSDAVRCAVELQKTATSSNIPLKIGIHEGDMIFKGLEIKGEGVEVASGLQERANEGCITISEPVYDNVKNKKGFSAEFLGEEMLDHSPVRLYRVKCYEMGKNLEVKPPAKPKKRIIASYVVILLVIIILILSVLWALFSIPGGSGEPNRTQGQFNTRLAEPYHSQFLS